MKNGKRLLAVIVVLLLMFAAGCGADTPLPEDTEQTQPTETQPAATEPETETALAPDFTVYDAQGNEVHLSDFVGKPVVLNFWASWCGPCKMEMPHFEEVYLEQGEQIQFLMVNLTTGGETVEGVTAFIQEQGYTFPVFYDTQADAAMMYGISSIPATFFIDAQGGAVARATGAIDKETLLKGIDMILP